MHWGEYSATAIIHLPTQNLTLTITAISESIATAQTKLSGDPELSILSLWLCLFRFHLINRQVPTCLSVSPWWLMAECVPINLVAKPCLWGIDMDDVCMADPLQLLIQDMQIKKLINMDVWTKPKERIGRAMGEHLLCLQKIQSPEFKMAGKDLGEPLLVRE